jgi:ABC-type transporter Mla maintaining outer membrane lipid asymmetry ATPase subunit MlaF
VSFAVTAKSSVRASPAVEFRSVEKRYSQGPIILDAFSLSAAHGDFIALIGPSGCGKSTLLKLVAGLSPVSRGELIFSTSSATTHLADATRSSSASARDDLAYVFQEPTLLPWLTVAQNVALPLDLRAVPSAQRTALVRDALALVGLTVSGLGVSYLPRECLRPMVAAGMLAEIEVAPALPVVRYVAMHKGEHRSALTSSIVMLAQSCCDFTRMFQAQADDTTTR